MSSNTEWERPTDNVPFPNIWTEFYQKESKSSEKVVRYWIQDMPDDRSDEAIEFMEKYYIPDMPLTACIGLLNSFQIKGIKLIEINF